MMKKLGIILIAVAVACTGTFYAGLFYGKFNGRIEGAVMETGPLMNLLLAQAGNEKELIEMNRERLYFNLDLYDALSSSPLVSSENKRMLEERILVAKDYWQAAGGQLLQSEEQKKQMRQTVEQIQSATGVQMKMTMNGVTASPFLFEEKERRIAALFSRYADRQSRLHDFIVGMVKEAKKNASHASEPTSARQENVQ
jgi:Ni,Fe-hydrogenase I large subunit